MKKARGLRNKVINLEKVGLRLSKNLLFLGGLIYKESKRSVKLPIHKRLKAYRKGFNSESFILYKNNPKSYDINLYVSDYQRYNVVPKLNERHGIILADKNLFTDFMHKYKQFMPAVYAEVINGKLYPLDKEKYCLETFSCVKEYIARNKALVFKPVSGYGGNGVLICKVVNDELLINKEKSSFDELKKELEKMNDYQVCEYVQQGDYSNKIFPKTANTIRVFSIYDEKTGKAQVLDAIHRIGTESSYPVDNFTQGGLCASIDIETGELGVCATHSSGGKVNWREEHPDTKSPIKGSKIDNWHFIRENIEKLAEYAHYTPVIGWDIVSTNDGFRIIEANDAPSVSMHQMHKPWLINKTLKEFYERNGLLRKSQIKAANKYYATLN